MFFVCLKNKLYFFWWRNLFSFFSNRKKTGISVRRKWIFKELWRGCDAFFLIKFLHNNFFHGYFIYYLKRCNIFFRNFKYFVTFCVHKFYFINLFKNFLLLAIIIIPIKHFKHPQLISIKNFFNNWEKSNALQFLNS